MGLRPSADAGAGSAAWAQRSSPETHVLLRLSNRKALGPENKNSGPNNITITQPLFFFKRRAVLVVKIVELDNF